MKVFVLLGSNTGDSLTVFRKSIETIGLECGSVILKSSVYITEPWGFKCEAPNFYNMAIAVATCLSPDLFMERLLAIEEMFGRVRTESTEYENRILDLDILLWGDEIIDSKNLIVPHPRMTERRFALEPLCEIAQDIRHPKNGKSISELLQECTDDSQVTRSGDL
jgi:2-amino-4-hydroxy-6-hydroxymethyldihydropteridine diphosphokinase